MKNLTLKRLLKRHRENPQDAELHKVIESGNVDKKELNKLVRESTKQKPFDKKK
ncbi:MAG: hypothetical protein ACREHC_00655 [Candidatus Levyibacteriota bacterium]